MKKRMSLGVTIALMAITAAITLSLTYQFAMSTFNERVHNINERQQMYTKLQEIDQKVRQYFYGVIDEEELNNSIASGYMDGLGDSHSIYLNAEQYKKMQTELTGSSVGMGAQYIQLEDGTLQVIHVDRSSPAQTAGLVKGDIVTGVGDILVGENSSDEVISALSGDLGEKKVLHILRGEETLDLEITLNQYEVYSVEYSILSSNLGYISISEFNENTYAQFQEAMDALQQSSVLGLVIDVRNNPGGTLESVSGILDTLLPAGNIVFSEDKEGTKKVLYTSDAKQYEKPIAVLVNENTASAAELLACAIQDYNKGTVVGTTTYGKGTMQQLFTLSDGSALNLTIAKFIPPLSENFDGVGVSPDIAIELPEELQNVFYFLTEETDVQLKAAVSVLTNGSQGSQNEGEGGVIVDEEHSVPDSTQSEEEGAESPEEGASEEGSSEESPSSEVARIEYQVYGRF